MNIFVVGTDTEIGKTVGSALICTKYGDKSYGEGRLAYWKPVASGSKEGRDVLDVAELSGAPVINEAYLMEEPLSPHLAARLENRFVDPAHLTEEYRRLTTEAPERSLVIEGVGGIHVPLNDDGFLWTDWMVELGLPAVLVARSVLGTINHTLLTLECLRRRNVEIVGVLMNGPLNPENRSAIETFGKVDILGQLQPLDPLNRESLHNAAQDFDPDGRVKAALGL